MSDDTTTGARSAVTVQYPSADFPPVPAFRLDVPGDWMAVPRTQSVMILNAPAPTAGFRSNVIVSARRVPPPPDPVAELASAVDRDLELSDYEVVERKSSPDGANPALATVVRLTTDEGIRIQTHQLLVYVPGSDRSAHVMSITGSVAVEAPPAEHESIRSVVWSFKLAR